VSPYPVTAQYRIYRSSSAEPLQMDLERSRLWTTNLPHEGDMEEEDIGSLISGGRSPRAFYAF